MLRVGRPEHVVGRTLGGVLRIGAAVVAAAPVEVFRAVAGQAVVHHGGVFLVLHELLHVIDTHPIQVVALGIHGLGPVGRDAGPARIVFLFLVLRHIDQFAGGQDVLEAIDFLFFLGFLRAFCLIAFLVVFLLLVLLFHHFGALHLEGEFGVVLQFELAERQMLGVEGVLDDGGNFHRQSLHVKSFGLGLGDGIYNVVFRAFGSFPFIPELVGVLEPVGPDGGAEHHVAHLLGGKPVCQGIVRLLGRGCDAEQQHRQREKEHFFHIGKV